MRLVDLIPAPYRVIVVDGLLVAVAGGAAALAWQVQAWRYGKQLAEQAQLHTETRNQLTLAAAAQQRVEQDKRLALEQRLSASEQTQYKELSDAQTKQTRLRDRLPLLICGCQSSSMPRIQPVVVQCQPLPVPAAWFMEERAPDLTQRMLNELSPSPMPETKD